MKNVLNKNQSKKKSSFFPSMWKFMFVIMFLAATNSFGQLLSENFESVTYPPTGWTISNNNGIPWAATANASGYGVGSQSTFIDFWDISAGSEQLTTIQFSPTTIGDILVFSEAYAAYQNSDDQLEILYSTDGGISFNQLILLDGGDAGPLNTGGDITSGVFTPAANQWQTLSYALPVGTNMIQLNGISAYGNDLYLDNVQVLEPCTGSPNAGSALSFASPVCPFNNFSVLLIGADNTPGLTYQWQSSSDNLSYNDIAGATSSILVTSENNAAYYQCVVTCSNSGMSATSVSVLIDVNVSTLPILQNFEGATFPDNCWSESHNTSLPWSHSNAASADGDGFSSAMFDFWDLPSGSEQLTSSQFTPTSAGYFLYFDEAYASALNYDDQLEVLFSTDGGSTFTQLALLDGGDAGALNTGGDISGGPFVPNSGQWKSFSYAMPLGTNMVQFNAISAYGNNLFLDNVKVYVPIPCTGTPVAGTAVSGSNPVGQNVNFRLNLSGAENTDGLTYQWQSSSNNINYSDIVGAVAKNLTTSGTSDTWYQCIVTCSNSIFSANSIPVLEQEHLGFTWTPISTLAPHPNMGITLLLSDGSVLCKSNAGGNDGIGTIFDRLTPDIHGSYVNGTWSSIAPMVRSRYAFSSEILKDGRVYAAGGEYGTDGVQAGKHGETYDPLTDTWTECIGPGHTMSDGNSIMLEDGRVLQALVYDYYNLRHTTIYDPATNIYSPGPDCEGVQNESMWLKLADNSILFVDMPRLDSSYTYTTPFHSERYIPSLNQWIADSEVPVALYDPYGYETGPAFLLPDGRAFFIGSTGHTAYYTPSGSVTSGSWVAGPDLPNGLGMPDGPGATMVNGKILFACSLAPFQGNNFPAPTYFYEFDYLTNSYTQVNTPNATGSFGLISQQVNLLNLPDGSVLTSINQDVSSAQYYVYSPSGAPLPAGKPVIGNITQTTCTTYTITGTGFNGISQGSAFGDENQNDSNYPLVRLTSGTNVYYARSFNWNSTGVQRGGAADTTHFTLPAGLIAGTYSVVVVANGNASEPVNLTIGTPVQPGAIAGNATPCNNSTQTYSVPLVAGATSYLWTIPAAWSGISTTNSITVNVINASGPVSVRAVNACGSSPAQILLVAVALIPTPVITANGPLSICQSSSLTLSTGAYAAYIWSNGGNNSSTTVSSAGTYRVTVTTVPGCTGTASRTVTVNANPTPNITGTGITTYCSGSPATLIVAAYSAYLWSTGAVTQSVIIPANTPGTYSVTVTNTNGCQGNASIVLNNACTMPTGFSTSGIAVTTAVANWVQPACVYGYIIRISKHNANSWTPHTITPNSHYTFSQLSRGSQYDWQIETICNAAQTSVSGFSATQTFTTLPRLENGEIGAMDYAFNVYPNPTNDRATIAFTSDKEEAFTIRLMDVTGRVVLSSTNTSVLGENQFQMNLSQIAKGVYTVILQNGDAVMQSKIVVQ